MKLGRIFGINVSVHWSFLIALTWFTAGEVFGPTSISFIVTTLVFGIILLHEFGHSLTAKYLGHKAEHININLLGGIALIDDENKVSNIKWWKSFFISSAGPAINIVIAFVMSLTAIFLGFDNFEVFTSTKGKVADLELAHAIGSAEYIFYIVYRVYD